MRRIAITGAVVAGAIALIVLATGASNGSGDPTYKVELDNAFGLVTGEQVKIAGVPAGQISKIGLDRHNLHAVITISVNQKGFGSFHRDTFCESRPQSLIGEYFLECNPGNSGPVLRPGSTIPVTHTFSTIPADLLADTMRMPYRQRLTLIVNELGAGVAGNSENLQAALRRAVPALTETDSLLSLLANDSHTLQSLTQSANTLVTELANNSASVQRFIVQANNAATDTAAQQANLRSTLHELPGFLEQLRPALAKLGAAVTANEPALTNLNASAGQLDRLLSDLPPFSRQARPAIKTLGQASVTGRAAVIAAKPAISNLNQFAKPTPELAQNLAIVLHSLDDRSMAVEPDPRSPGGKGFTGLEALLQYVFNQVLDLNYLGPWGHVQAIDAFVNPLCSAYATPSTIAANIKSFGAATTRQCYSWLGPTQPGVNSPDPSNPGACVPDPGGEPPYAPAGAHPVATACKSSSVARPAFTSSSAHPATGGGSTGSGPGTGSAPPIDLGKTISGVLGAIGGVSGSGSASSGSGAGRSSASGGSPSSASSSGGGSTSGGSSSSGGGSTSGGSSSLGDAQQLLDYLLSP